MIHTGVEGFTLKFNESLWYLSFFWLADEITSVSFVWQQSSKNSFITKTHKQTQIETF